MLFPYKYVPHQMGKMQKFIDYIFYEVWCKAPIGLVFSGELFDGCPELREIVSSFGFAHNAPERGKKFYKDLKGIYALFAELNPQQINQFKQWYEANNDIENVCANIPAVHIARYADIQPGYPELSEQLAIFFKSLYDQQLLDLAAFKKVIGDIDDHYQNFMRVNTSGKCPFCGIGDVKGVHHTKREAYDHYLPKGLYPFNSINFRNLAPACHECNSTYKLAKDPLNSATGRRKAFYPYTNTSYSIDIKIDLKKSDVDKLTHDDIEIKYGPASLNEEIETWKDVYGIEERYKAKCRSPDAKDWLEQVRTLKQAHGLDPNAYLNTLNEQTKISPFANSNFFKKAFLEGCERAGLFT